MGAILGISSTRSSDTQVRDRVTSQMQSDQLDMLRVQMQLTTGQRIQRPSEDVSAALRIIGLQRLLEQRQQVRTNLETNQSFLTATDTALASVSDVLAEARGVALGAIDSTLPDSARQVAAQQIQETINQLVNVGNSKFRDRYLFAGTETATSPFEKSGGNLIQFLGNDGWLSSYSDIDRLFETNVPGSEVFGAISDPVPGAADLDPIVTADTRLADLRGGQGIASGSIAVADGTTSVTIDLSTAETVGDVAELIERATTAIDLDVEITHTGLKIEGGLGTLLTVNEVGGGATARELGIHATSPLPVINGSDLDPVLRVTTPLANVLGRRAYDVVRSSGSDNDILFQADEIGLSGNGIKIVFSDDGSVVMPGVDETATYDTLSRTLTVTVKTGATTARDVVRVVEAAHALGTVPVTAMLDPIDAGQDGAGIVDATPPGDVAGTLDEGEGDPLDTSGLQITNAGTTHVISLAGAETIEDVLNLLNAPELGLRAQINSAGNGFDVRSTLSGADFSIGENGGTTATQLGLRTFNAATRLEDLNHGLGVSEGAGTDFSIALADGTQVDVDIAGIETVGQVIAQLNTLAPGSLEARLAVYGNGIELIDRTAGGDTLTVARELPIRTAIELGFVPAGEESSAAGVPTDTATATVASAGANNDLIFSAVAPGTDLNGVTISFQNTGSEGVTYNDVAGTLTFDIIAGVTDANRIMSILSGDPAASAAFTATLDATDGSPNDGSGPVDAGATAAMAGGTQLFASSDTNPLQTEGVFTALSRLYTALTQNDLQGIEQSIAMLDEQVIEMGYSRAALGARQQHLDHVQLRVEAEDVDLQSALSQEFDADLVEVISELAARQAAFEASMKVSAGLLQTSLMDYL